MPDFFREIHRQLFSSGKLRKFIKIRTFRWWLKYAWKVKTSLVVFTTALILLGVSLWGYLFYCAEVNKISDRFLRLQVFGPGEIFVTPFPAGEVKNFFRVETRSPAGNPLSGAEIKLDMMHTDGTRFYTYVDKTDTRGVLNLELPSDEKLPPRVNFRITAVHGKKEEACEGMFSVRPVQTPAAMEATPMTLEEIFFRDEAALVRYEASFGEVPGDWSRDEMLPTFWKRHVESGTKLPVTLEISPENVLAPAGTSLKLRVGSDRLAVPAVIGVWYQDFMFAYRPRVLGQVAREVEIPIPEGFTGLMVVTVHDYRRSPPVMMGQKFFFRQVPETSVEGVSKGVARTDTNAEKSPVSDATSVRLRVDEKLSAFHTQILEKETLRRNSRGVLVEFMSPELPVSGQTHAAQAAVAGQNVDETQDAQDVLHRQRLHAAARLLLVSLDWELGRWPNAVPAQNTFPAETLSDLQAVVTEILTGRSGQELEACKKLVTVAFHVQEEILRENMYYGRPGPEWQVRYWRQYPPLAHAPVVYDGMTSLQAAYRQDLQRFHERIIVGMGGIVCILLCLAGGLVLLVVMMAFLKIPTGRNIWLATLAVVIAAFLLAWAFFARADIASDTRNVIFQTWMPASSPHTP